ncbi:hypothetical protein BDF22DRAFT_695181 [Syncephalis plumigaleata]|nr:hypothetical protein BDF22DRAFT_695181 [Syncephalis plumigaleata]
MGENASYFNKHPQQQQQLNGPHPPPAFLVNTYENTGLPPPPPVQAQYEAQPQMAVVPDSVVHADQTCIDGGAHYWMKDYTLCGWCWLICFFPLGVVCCYLTADEKCTKCQKITTEYI